VHKNLSPPFDKSRRKGESHTNVLFVDGRASTNLARAYEHEYVRNNYVMDMSIYHGGVLIEHECV
jgi:prepilin-type processing-associated H-X9-DG protein